MSINNYYHKNASNIFACELEEESDYEDLVVNLQSELKKPNSLWNKENKREYDENRNYPGRVFASYHAIRSKWEITIYAIIRGGYFAHCNLDWEVEVESDDGINYDVYYAGEMARLPNYIQDFINLKILQLERVYKKYSTPIYKHAQMSNGVALYKKVK